MRVAHVNDIAFVGSTMVRGLRARGVDARLVEPARPGAAIPYPWKLAALPIRAAALLAAGADLRRQRLDLVHVHYARLGILGPLSGRPYVLHCHGTDIRGVTRGSAWGREVEPFLRGAKLVYVATPDLMPWVAPFRPDASFLPNPIELPPSDALEVEATRDLLVGVRLSAVKGSATIASLVAAVVAARPGTTVTIVEQGDGVGEVLAAAGAGASLVPPVPHDRMPALLRAHRIAIGQTRVGAIGNYELEALAAGVPVVAPFRHPEVYPSPPPLVDAADPAEIPTRIVELLADEGGRRDLAEAGRRWITLTHDPAGIVERLIEDYGAVLRR